MVRIALMVLASLGLGAGGMWLASNFKLRVEAVGGAATANEPGRLPESVLNGTMRFDPPFDNRIVQASGGPPDPAAAVAGAAAVAAAKKAADEIAGNRIVVTHLLDGESSDQLSWPTTANPVHLRTRKLKLQFRLEKADDAALEKVAFDVVFNNQVVKSFTSSKGVGDFDFSTTQPEFAGRDKLEIYATRENPADKSKVRIGFITAESSTATPAWTAMLPTAPAVVIAKVFNGRFAPGVAKSGNTAIAVFDGYQRVQLQPGQANAQYDFFLFDVASQNIRSLLATGKASGIRTIGKTVECRVDWDKLPPVKNGLLMVVRERGLGTDTSSMDAAVLNVSASPELPAVEWAANPVRPAGVSVVPKKSGQTYLLGTEKVDVDVEFTSATFDAVKANSRLLLYVDQNPKDAASVPRAIVPGSSLTVNGEKYTYRFAAVDLGTDGEHVVAAVLESGGAAGPDSKSLTVRVRRGGFAISRVSPTDFSNATDYKIRIAFNTANPVDASTVKAANFELKLDNAGNTVLASGDPIFDASSNTATVQATTPLPAGIYVLTVKGTDQPDDASTRKGLRDVYGNPLGGPFGEKGQDASANIVQPVGGQQPSVVATAFSMSTGPNVEFKEFEPRKNFLNGFNPADRVETRVVRLYYNRDAARVVQVVNRDAKAFNAQSVDVRRRAADRSRDEANASTDERKKQESLAVQAATEARAAENKLKELQSKLTQARTQAASATAQIGQRQQELTTIQRAQGRERTETFDDPAQARVLQLEADIAKLKVARDAGTSATEETVLEAQKALAEKQRKQAATIGEVRTELDKRDDIKASNAKIAVIQAKLSNPATPATEFPQLQADLDAANQNHSQVVANALVQNPALATKLDDAAIDVQKQQLEVDRKQASFAAGKELTTKESALVEAKRNLTRAQVQVGDAALGSAAAVQNELRGLQAVVSAANAKEESLRSDIISAMNDVQAKRIKEVELTLKARELDQKELRARENQFRSEVAAAKEDADIYAPGKPDSFDPVRQCSLSVIGEGLIQIRGPIKGVNIIRTMINQIDAPTGQVRVGVHTVQVNGERVDRMNKVVANIQRYLDHSRFLTAQSSQMLRKAVTAVAARKAEECNASLLPGCSQADRDAKYLTCFFGKDFLDELRQLDSEFLRTGNKLLSLHSMDSTSLSAALTLLALAKNDIRAEILQEFATQTQTKLPEAEQNFYLAGLACPTKCEACFDKKFCMLAQNAKFESFRGFFNLEIQGADTLTPVQREFVRLAQIFKTRLVTELELRQRVIERSLLEDRLGDYETELKMAKAKEEQAKGVLDGVRTERQNAINGLATVLAQKFTDITAEVNADVDFAIADFRNIERGMEDAITNAKKNVNLNMDAPLTIYVDKKRTGMETGRQLVVPNAKDLFGDDPEFNLKLDTGFKETIEQFKSALRTFKKFKYTNDEAKLAQKFLEDIEKKFDSELSNKPVKWKRSDFEKIPREFAVLHRVVKAQLRLINDSVGKMIASLQSPKASATAIYSSYVELIADAINRVNDDTMRGEIEKARNTVDKQFAVLLAIEVKFSQATQAAQLARRPLDEKKLLDMLIDEMEDKYIELLDGTRAHTANVDNYLKALSTALDDDFNTQFYNPAFAKIRTLGAGWDVQLGQIESTSVLTNNRVFAKVSPAASMEFDLPKRDIFIKEAFKGAKAAVDEYGALLSDPTFLSLAKMYGGAPTAATFGAGGSPAVRGVLPGLPSSADEMLMTQAGSNRKEFGTALEALIPDPAVYKFETGTGYEIRPVMSPDGQAVVFGFDYLYTTDVREPVRADEKHLGRVKRHFVHTDVQLSNFEMREVSKYWVSLKAARTGRGVALLQDVPGVGVLFRPLPSASSSLQQNLIYSQATLFPTLFDLMGLRYAPAIADIDPEFTKNDEFVVRGRRDYLRMFIFDYGASRVDDALRILTGERRPDLYRSQHTIPWEHPNGYRGPGMRQRDAILEEGYDPREAYPKSQYVPGMVLPNRSTIPGGPGFVPESYELPSTMGGETKRGPAGLTPPAGMGFTPPGGEYTARPIGTTVTPQYGPASIRAPGASRLSPSIPPPGTPLPFPNELPK